MRAFEHELASFDAFRENTGGVKEGHVFVLGSKLPQLLVDSGDGSPERETCLLQEHLLRVTFLDPRTVRIEFGIDRVFLDLLFVLLDGLDL